MEGAWKNHKGPVSAAMLVGTYLEAYVHVKRVIYCKVKNDEVIGSEWGVVMLSLEEVINGDVPSEFTGEGEGIFRRSEITFTASGLIPRINYGADYHMIAKLVYNAKYGYQYELTEFSSDVNLESEEEFLHFLRATIGDSKTKLLCDAFDNPLEVLKEGDIDKLLQVKGLGEATVSTLLEKFRNEMQTGLNYAKLAPFGLTKGQADKVTAAFGGIDAAKDALTQNPYWLIGKVDGYGWKKTDAIALNVGVDPCGDFRLRAYTKFILNECAESGGHTWVTLEWLRTALGSIAFNLTDAMLIPMMQKWIDEENPESNPFLHYDKPTKRIGLLRYYQEENLIAHHLLRLHHSTTKVYSNEEIEDAIKESEREVGFEYTEEQRDAIYSCLHNNVSIVMGSGGTGKSSIMRPITKLIRRSGGKLEQCSLSGKAASNLSAMTAADGKTIHRLLAYNPESGTFTKNESNPIEADLIILDEISLVGTDIFLKLIQAIPDGCKFIMLGDHKQLESIGTGNLVKDIPLAGVVNAKTLVQIHRQAAKSGIITESLRVSAGEKICGNYAINERRGELQDLKIITYTETPLTASTLLSEFHELFFNRHIPIEDIAIVLPMKDKGDASVLQINRAIQTMINDGVQEDDITVKRDGQEVVIHPGDRIIIKKNNYDTWRLRGEYSATEEAIVSKEPVFNGNMGFYVGMRTLIIKEKKQEARRVPCVVVKLDMQGDIYIPSDKASCVDLGYAITCHAAQGSGVPYVLVGLDMRAYALLSKEWVYTALTRAKKECVLISQISALRRASEISRVSVKHTWLQELLVNKENYFKAMGTLPPRPKSMFLEKEEEEKHNVESED